MTRRALQGAIAALALMLAACASQEPPAATPTPLVTPSALPPTAPPTPTASLTPTPRPPTATPSRTPTPAPRSLALDLTVAAHRFPITLHLGGGRLEGDTLRLDLTFANTSARELQGPTFARGSDAVLTAGGTPQNPTRVEGGLVEDIGPPGLWLPGATNSGTLVFDRPGADRATLRLPGFPPVQIDLSAGSAVALAEDGVPLPSPTPHHAVAALAEARAALNTAARAVREKNAEPFQAVFTPAAAQFFGGDDPFQFARETPFGRFEFEWLTTDLARGARLERDGERVVAIRGVGIATVYTLRGVEDETFRHVLTLDLERRDRGWQVTGARADRAPFWAAGLVGQTRSAHFLAFHRPGTTVDAVLQDAEAAHTALVATLGELVDPMHVLIVADRRDVFAQLTQQSGDTFVGSARFDNLLTPDGIVVVSRALYINEAAFAAGGLENTRVQTIQHELVHLALAPWSRPWTPPWLVEGAAGLFAGETRFPALDRFMRTDGPDRVGLAQLTGLPTLEQSAVPLAVAYAYSTAVSEALVHEFGREQYLALYRAFADVSIDRIRRAAGGGASISTDRFGELQREVTTEALQRVLGLTLDEVEARAERRIAERQR